MGRFERNKHDQKLKKPNPTYFFQRVEWWISVSTVLLILVFWYILSANQLVSPLFLPSPSAVWTAFLMIVQDGYKGISLWGHVTSSLMRIFEAVICAILTAVPLGLVSGYSNKIRAIFYPIVEFYRPLPPLAYYTLLVIWLGIGDMSKVTLLYLAAFAPIFISCLAAVQQVPQQRLQAALTLGASNWQIFWHIIVPSALPDIFTGLRTAIGFTYTTLVAAEMVAAISGIGWMVLDASKFLRSDIVFAGIFVMGITGIVIDTFVRLIERWVVPWKGKG